MSQAVKILATTADGFTVGGYGVVWGGQDVVGDYFDKSTDFWFDRLTERPMILFQHGADSMLKRAVVGQVVSKRIDDTGLWVEAQITAARKYADAIRALVEKGILGLSTGAVGHLVSRTKQADGRALITSWPVAEISLTPTPAEPRTLGVRALKSLSLADPSLAGVAADLDIEDARTEKGARMPTRLDDLPDSAFAYVEPGERDAERKTVPRERRHFPHHGPDGALDADMLAASIREATGSPLARKALPHLLRHAAGHDDAADPVWADSAPADLLLVAHSLTRLAEGLADDLKALAQLRRDTKSGWASTPTRREDLRDVARSLTSLIDRAEGADTGADVAEMAELWTLQQQLLEV